MTDQILYTSTRDASVRVSAAEAIARGISPEGGLYVPCSVPSFTHEELTALIPQGYAARAEAVLRRFLWHDRIHARAMWRTASALWSSGLKNPFFFL